MQLDEKVYQCISSGRYIQHYEGKGGEFYYCRLSRWGEKVKCPFLGEKTRIYEWLQPPLFSKDGVGYMAEIVVYKCNHPYTQKYIPRGGELNGKQWRTKRLF